MTWHESELARRIVSLNAFIRDQGIRGKIKPQTVKQINDSILAITDPLGILPSDVNRTLPEHEPTPAILKVIYETQQEQLLKCHPELEKQLNQWMTQNKGPNR